MRYDQSIRKFARTSFRLNILLVFCLSLVLLLVGVIYWAGSRLVKEQIYKIDFHFSRLMEDIHEQESFLIQIARHNDQDAPKLDQRAIPLQYRLLDVYSEVELYEGREFSFALPFTLAVNRRSASIETSQGAAKLGVLLSNYYGSYWSTSSYASPQTYVFDDSNQISLAAPAINSPDADKPTPDFTITTDKLRQHIAQVESNKSGEVVRWAPAMNFSGNDSSELVSYIRTSVSERYWVSGHPDKQVIVASLLDLNKVIDYSQITDWLIFDSMELISPQGLILMGDTPVSDSEKEGLSLTSAGFLVKATSVDGWKAYYHLDYKKFFSYAKLQIILLISILVFFVFVGFMLLRWYSRRVVMPAQQAHEQVVESDIFSRAVIHSAPVALCVLARKSRHVVMENHLAHEWLGDNEKITKISERWQFDDDIGDNAFKNAAVTIDGRQLEVGFSAARYKGEEVVLCAFSDVTAYKLAETALDNAKRAADASNEAKTVFLATMSHEIRTPLYGVLGALELLALSKLSPQQKGHLQTMQRSSITLMQVISDILDISKIESGQMAIDLDDFNPIEMIEEVLQAYDAAARIKGLQIYSCVDTDVPGRVSGDVGKIRQVLNNLISNAIKFTDFGRVVVRLKAEAVDELVHLQWQVTDTGFGIPREHQKYLFEPFYQAHRQQHTIGGTGLGLSICWRLCQLMSGHLEVTSEIGLGSSFIFRLELPLIDSSMSEAYFTTKLRNTTVLVRSPIKEQALNICDWLNYCGARAVFGIKDSEAQSTSTVLVDLMPEHSGALDWLGGRVVCVDNDTSFASFDSKVLRVSPHSLGRLVSAVAVAQGVSVIDSQRKSGSSWQRLNLNVLVAEDNPINQMLLKEQLEELGCSVGLASSGVEALQIWEFSAFDVVLTDVNMPLMNGYELTKKLREEDLLTPIIGVTANAMREEAERCKAVGMNSCMVKPISLSALHNALVGVCGDLEGALEESLIEVELDCIFVVADHVRDVFVSTMRDDVAKTRLALADKNVKQISSMLHRIRGGLAVVHAQDFVCAVEELEEKLNSEGLSAVSQEDIQHFLESLMDETEKLNL